MEIKDIHNLQDIANLIEKYFDGNTSNLEESILLDYFQKARIPIELEQYRPFFYNLELLSHNPELLYEDQKYIFEENELLSENKTYTKVTGRIISTILTGIAACLIFFFIVHHSNKSENFVVIDGVKYKDEKHIKNAFETTIENVKIEMGEVFFDLCDIDE